MEFNDMIISVSNLLNGKASDIKMHSNLTFEMWQQCFQRDHMYHWQSESDSSWRDPVKK